METPKPEKLRNYLYEYALLALCTVCIYLFLEVRSLNVYIRTDLQHTNISIAERLTENTNAMNIFNNNIKQNK